MSINSVLGKAQCKRRLCGVDLNRIAGTDSELYSVGHSIESTETKVGQHTPIADNTQGLISITQLSSNLHEPTLVVLLADMQDPVAADEACTSQYVPFTQRFDFDKEICHPQSPYPHTMPTAAQFERQVRALGINANSQIVVYDSKGIYSAPRAWWMFKSMGHNNVWVLDGGLPAWQSSGLSLTAEILKKQRPGDFDAKPQCGCWRNTDEVFDHLGDPATCLLDARSAGRFHAQSPEPRAGVRSGHIPGSINLHYADCIEQGFLKSPQQLQHLFEQAQVQKSQQLVFSCGSGVTACLLALAAYQAGFIQLSVYDGSWTEWGSRGDLPVEY